MWGVAGQETGIKAAVATFIASQCPHLTSTTSGPITENTILAFDNWVIMLLINLHLDFQGPNFSNMMRTKAIIPIFNSNHNRFCRSHAHTPAITSLHLQLCIFTTSHLVSHTAITLSSKHPLQQFHAHFGAVGDTRFARFFAIRNYPAVGMPLLVKISFSH